MLQNYPDTIEKIAFVFGHCGLQKDRGNRLYSISALAIAPGLPPKKFSSLIRYPKLTSRDRYYSNLSKEQLHKAPDIKQVAAELATFLADSDVAAIIDPYENFEDIKEICAGKRVVDLSFAIEFFLPYLHSTDPKTLFEYLFKKNRSKLSFDAEEIVDLAVELVKHICSTTLNDSNQPSARALRYYLEKSATLFGGFFLRLTRSYSEYFGELFSPVSKADSPDWQQFLETFDPKDIKKSKFKKPVNISTETITRIYKDLSESGNGIQFREEQARYGRHITESLNEGSVLCLEAGTGTGKTLGYLVPVLEFLRRNPTNRVVISTYTKSLQEQIFYREIRFAKAQLKLYEEIPTALLKGKAGYLCSQKLFDAYEELRGGNLLAWLYMVNLTFHFRRADIDSIGWRVKKELDCGGFLGHTLKNVSARDDCSPHHSACPAQITTGEAAMARLVVTNHHKLAFLDKDPILNGLFRNYIIDEANHFESAVRNAFKEEADTREAILARTYLRTFFAKLLLTSNKNVTEKIQKAIDAIETLAESIAKLRTALQSIDPQLEWGEEKPLLADQPLIRSSEFPNIVSAIQKGISVVVEIFNFLEDSGVWNSLNIVMRSKKKAKREVAVLSQFGGAIGRIAESLKESNSAASYLLLKKHCLLFAGPVDVSDIVRTSIYKDRDSVVFTSATMLSKSSFTSFKKIVGIDRPLLIDKEISDEVKKFRFAVVPSPFSKEQMKIIVPGSAVSGEHQNKKAWLDSIARQLPGLIISNKGRTLVLFSSYSDLTAVYERVFDKLKDTMYPFWIQQPGRSTVGLCEKFRSSKESVVFGVDTFWYGVDFKGDTLTQVIITRIPYPSPADPVQIARKKLVPPKEYWSRYRYDTDIKMKQGIGRLIRCHTDSGTVVILDSRYKDFE
nr:ATP-dependent DNA helicase [Desulfobulbaceae bacterium]